MGRRGSSIWGGGRLCGGKDLCGSGATGVDYRDLTPTDTNFVAVHQRGWVAAQPGSIHENLRSGHRRDHHRHAWAERADDRMPGEHPRCGEYEGRFRPGADDHITGGNGVPAAAEFKLHSSEASYGETFRPNVGSGRPGGKETGHVPGGSSIASLPVSLSTPLRPWRTQWEKITVPKMMVK